MGYVERLVIGLVVFPSLLFASGNRVTFLATATGGIKIPGECSESQAITTEGKLVGALVNLRSCTTNNSLSDNHFRAMLHVAEHPIAGLQITGDGATITIAGKSSPVSLKTTGDKLSFVVKLSNHGITPPSFLGITPRDEVQIEAVGVGFGKQLSKGLGG